MAVEVTHIPAVQRSRKDPIDVGDLSLPIDSNVVYKEERLLICFELLRLILQLPPIDFEVEIPWIPFEVPVEEVSVTSAAHPEKGLTLDPGVFLCGVKEDFDDNVFVVAPSQID